MKHFGDIYSQYYDLLYQDKDYVGEAKYVDNLIAKYHSKGLLFKGDANQTVKEYLGDLKHDIQQSDYDHDVETGMF